MGGFASETRETDAGREEDALSVHIPPKDDLHCLLKSKINYKTYKLYRNIESFIDSAVRDLGFRSQSSSGTGGPLLLRCRQGSRSAISAEWLCNERHVCHLIAGEPCGYGK